MMGGSSSSLRLSMNVVCISMFLFCAAVAAFTPTTPRFHIQSSALLYSTNNSNDENEKQPHIVILGGGFGGINTALTLPTLPWSDNNKSNAMKPKITLIDKSERFVFLPLLYELCVDDASVDEVAPTFKSLLDNGLGGSSGLPSLSGLPDLSQSIQLFSRQDEDNKSSNDKCEVSFLQAQVEGINVDTQQVIVTKSSSSDDDSIIESIDYDALVIATGAEVSLDAIPGGTEYALPFYTVEQSFELKRRLALLDTYLDGKKETNQAVDIVVVGGGYAGVELALNLVDRFGSNTNDGSVQVSLVHRGEQVLENATKHNRNTGVDRLKSAGVNVMTSTSVVEVLPYKEDDSSDENMPPSIKKQKCVLKVNTKSDDDMSTEELLPTTLLLWTAGATPTSVQNKGIRNSLLPRDAMGRILTSPTLNVPEYPNVFAIGDCSRPKKVPYPGTAQVAIQQATVAAWNIYATLMYEQPGKRRGEQRSKLLPFKFLNLGEMMTLGSDDATISTLGGLVELNGPAASWLRRWIYAVRMPTAKQGVIAAVDATGRKLARGAATRRKSKPVDWK